MATYWENSCSFGLRYVSWYKYLIVSLVFSHLGFWSGNLFLIAPFPDLCLLVPFFNENMQSLFWSKNKKNRYTLVYPPCIPQFCYIKVGYKGVYIVDVMSPDWDLQIPCYCLHNGFLYLQDEE